MKQILLCIKNLDINYVLISQHSKLNRTSFVRSYNILARRGCFIYVNKHREIVLSESHKATLELFT